MKRVLLLVLFLISLTSLIKADAYIWTDSVTNVTIPFPENSVVIDSSRYNWMKATLAIPQYGFVRVHSSKAHGDQKMTWDDINRLTSKNARLITDDKVTDLGIEARRRTYQCDDTTYMCEYIIRGDQYAISIVDLPFKRLQTDEKYLLDSLIYNVSLDGTNSFRHKADQVAYHFQRLGNWAYVISILWLLVALFFYRMSKKGRLFRLSVIVLWTIVALVLMWLNTKSVTVCCLGGVGLFFLGIVLSSAESFSEAWDKFMETLQKADI